MRSASRAARRDPIRSACGSNCRPIASPAFGPIARSRSKAGAWNREILKLRSTRLRRSATIPCNAEPAARLFRNPSRMAQARNASTGSNAASIPGGSTPATPFPQSPYRSVSLDRVGRLGGLALGAQGRPIDGSFYKARLEFLQRIGIAPLKMPIQGVEAIAGAVAGVRDGYARVLRVKRDEFDHGHRALKQFGIRESRRRLNVV